MMKMFKWVKDSDFAWLLIELRPQMKWQLLSVMFMVAGTITSLIDPLILKWLIDVVIPRRNLHLLALGALLMLLAYGGRVALSGISGLCTYHVSQKILSHLRIRLFKHVTRLSMDYHDNTPVGKSQFIIKDTLEELGLISADFSPQILRTLALSMLTVATMVHLDLHLALIILPLVPVFILAIRHFSRNLRRACDIVQEQGSNTSSFLQEHLSSVPQIQLLNRERSQVLKALRIWTQLVRAGYKRKRAEYFYGLCSSMVVVIGVVAVVSYGGLEVIRGTLTVGGLVAFYSYLGRLFEPLYVTVDLNSRFQRAQTCIRRIRDFLALQPSVQETLHPQMLPVAVTGASADFRALTFAYNDDRVILRNVTLSIVPNERIALVGPSGSGKSTIAKTLARLYDPHPGQVCVDGISIHALSLKDLRRNVCYVPQRAKLFNASLKNNLCYGCPEATEPELLLAAEMAGLMPVLAKLPQGWNHLLGPGGELLSGGERQRVAIARAILQRPRLLILDEATSEIDSLTELRIFEELNQRLADTTLVLISHRLNAVSWVDRIAVLADGRISGLGSHASLYGVNALYTQLYDQKAQEYDGLLALQQA
jgi:ABC-type multidrug transport system fused ATPase/permease subunit